jgi:hypothetical protein
LLEVGAHFDQVVNAADLLRVERSTVRMVLDGAAAVVTLGGSRAPQWWTSSLCMSGLLGCWCDMAPFLLG